MSPFRGLALVAPLLVLGACGGRSDPTFLPLDDTGGGTGGGVGCAEAIAIDFDTNVTLEGSLGGGGSLGGWCGGDAGSEDVYVMVANKNRDVQVWAVPEQSDFEPVVRIQEDFCEGSGLTEVCATKSFEGPWNFLAEKGHTYYVIVDSPSGTAGDYSVELRFNEGPKLAECDPHPETIEQVAGGVFLWTNEFGRGQGRVDGYCGGPGREDLFPLDMKTPGYVFAEVYSWDGLDPVLSVRAGCRGVGERTCSTEPSGDPSYAYVEYFVDDPSKNWHLAVDQTGVQGGSYELSVYFE